MIAKARSLAGDLPGRFDWFVSDAADLPTPSTPFSHVFCQQGLQYFADDLAALREMRRVLSGDGKLILTVWASANAYFLAQSEALIRRVSAEAGEKALGPFAYDGEGRVPALLAQAGFTNVSVATVSIERIIMNAEQGIREDILGSPLGPMVEEKAPHIMGEIVRDILTACAGNLENGDLVVSQHSTLVVASGAG
jgi:SAM-dependent methyltransferase